jgi:hypothetical protein
MKVKIGEQEYDVKINNQVIWDIEDVYDNEISKIMDSLTEMKTKELGLFIYQGIKDAITFEDFAKEIKLTQYVAAGLVIVGEINKAFGVVEKKK